MNSRLNILVFPCGSEIGLEIHRSLRYSRHINLIGASSVPDHGRFVFEKYIENIPPLGSPNFISKLSDVVKELNIDAIYPAMDAVITEVSQHVHELGCRVIASSADTTEICLSKKKTYSAFSGQLPTPKVYCRPEDIISFPVFMKPDIGYGSRGAKVIRNLEEVRVQLEQYPTSLIMDVLPGAEYTVDCFSNRHGKLLFFGSRVRSRIMNGISVHTYPCEERKREFGNLAAIIHKELKPRGAWFFQVKEGMNGELVLLEIASRLGGSSSLYRGLGVNFALLSVFDAFDQDVEIIANDIYIEMDRALDNRYKIVFHFDVAYIDFDDCLVIDNQVNVDLLKLIFQFINQKKKVVLITKHDKDIYKTLEEYRLATLFDDIIHLKKGDEKYKYMKNKNSIFIDDSHRERSAVHKHLGIPVFSPDAVSSLVI